MATLTLIAWVGLATVLGLVGLAVVLVNGLFDAGPEGRIVVWRGGRVARVCGPGGPILVWPFLEGITRVDMRPRTQELTGTADVGGATLTAALRATHVVLQPEKAAEVMSRAHLDEAVGQLVLAAYEAAIAEAGPEAAAPERDRTALGRAIKKTANETALTWGVDITGVEVADLRVTSG